MTYQRNSLNQLNSFKIKDLRNLVQLFLKSKLKKEPFKLRNIQYINNRDIHLMICLTNETDENWWNGCITAGRFIMNKCICCGSETHFERTQIRCTRCGFILPCDEGNYDWDVERELQRSEYETKREHQEKYRSISLTHVWLTGLLLTI